MHRMVCLIALTGILIEAHPLWAQTESKSTETTDGITWTYTVNADDGGVTLTGADPASGQLIIPDTLGSRPVTAIGYRAFAERTDLTSVTIPEGVTELGTSVFNGCTGLTSVTLPDSLTTLGNYVFKKCSSLQSITLPNKVTTIGQYAFVECAKLQSITIPDTVTSIENNTFQTCTNLQSIMIPDSVTSIGDYAFHGCTGLQSITIPGSVTSVGGMAFHGCKKLQSITFSDNVKTLGIFTFQECISLRQVILPDALEAIPDGLFSGCTSLTTVVLPASLKTIYVTANNNSYHPFYACPIETLIFRSSGTPTLIRNDKFYYINSYVKENLVCYTDTDSKDKWKYIMSGEDGHYTLYRLTNGAAIPGTTLLEIITANHGRSLTINPLTSGAATTNGQPLSEGAIACFDGIMEQTTSSSDVTVTVTPYAFGISGIRAEANGDVIVTAEVTGISGDATRDDAVMFADGTDVVAVYHTTGADGSSLQKEAGRTYVKGELVVKDRVEILLKGFLAADGLGAAEGAHRLTVYATKPIANTAASGE